MSRKQISLILMLLVLMIPGYLPVWAQSGDQSDWPECYGRLDDIYAWIHAYNEKHPDLIEIYDIGDTFCKTAQGCRSPGGDIIYGRDILVGRLTNENSASPQQ